MRTDPRLGELALRQGFVLTKPQVRAAGVPDAEVRRQVRRGAWQLPHHGVVAVVPPGPLTEAAMRACARALVRPGHVISDRSAARLHGLPLIAVPESAGPAVQLTGTGRACARHGPALQIRTAVLTEADVARWYGAPVTTVARTVVDLGRADRAQGLVAADTALRLGLINRVALQSSVAAAAGLPGIAAAREVLGLVSPLAESVLESLTRLFLHDEGFPAPTLQALIVDPLDGWRARVDFLWPERRVILEADGRLKYTGDALWAEKLRQERLEQLGFRVVRVRWAEVVWSPSKFADRLARAIDRQPYA